MGIGLGLRAGFGLGLMAYPHVFPPQLPPVQEVVQVVEPVAFRGPPRVIVGSTELSLIALDPM